MKYQNILKEWWLWVILVAGLIFWLSSCSTPEQMLPGLKEYRVGYNRNDFTPSPFPFPGEARSFDGIASFDLSCWYNTLGSDQSDWNKLAGVYRYFDGFKDVNSFILAWRPDVKVYGAFELCLYENIAKANVPHESAIYKVQAGQVFRFSLDEINGKYSLYIDNKLLGTQENDRPYKTIGKVGAYFGGNRKAPHDMRVYMDF